jgi:hypothetical protein
VVVRGGVAEAVELLAAERHPDHAGREPVDPAHLEQAGGEVVPDHLDLAGGRHAGSF